MFRSQVRQLMDANKVTIARIALDTGLSTRTINKARTDAGIAECRLSTLKRIADYLGVRVKDLFEE